MKKLLLILILVPVFRVALGRTWWPARAGWRGRWARRGARVLWVSMLGLVAGGGLVAATGERIVSHDEVTVLSVAAAFRHGQAMYPAGDAAADYGVVYGPATYLMYLPPMLLGIEGTGAYSVWVVVGLCVTMLLIWRMGWRQLPNEGAVGWAAWDAGLAAAGLYALMVSQSVGMEWLIKGDCWILLFGAVGLWAATVCGGGVAAALVGLAGGMLVDLKFPLLVLGLIPCAVLWERGGRDRVAAIAAAALIPLVALLPFALPGISLPGYLEQVREAGRHGFSAKLFAANLPVFLNLLLPGAAVLWMAMERDRPAVEAWMRRRAAFLLLLAVAVVLAMMTGAKHGAGGWHAMVLVGPLVFVDVELWKIARAGDGWTARMVAPLLAVGLVLVSAVPPAIAQAVRRRLHDRPPFVEVSMRDVEREALGIVRAHRGVTLQMGYSDTAHYNVAFVGPLLQMEGQPLFLDSNSRNEADLAGKDVSPAMLEALDRCAVKLWLIPKGGAPFSQESPYFLEGSIPRRDLYPASFQRVFLNRYRLLPNTNRYFDLWGCNL